MTEVIGVATAVGMAAGVARFVGFARMVWDRVSDELRFHREDVEDLNRRFARIFGERSPFD
jgi:hypothetical protein